MLPSDFWPQCRAELPGGCPRHSPTPPLPSLACGRGKGGFDNLMWGSDYRTASGGFRGSAKLGDDNKAFDSATTECAASDRSGPCSRRGCGSPEPSARADPPAYRGRGRTRTRAGSTTSRLPVSLLAWVRTICATSSASAAVSMRSSSSRIMPRTFSRWRMTSSPKSRSSVTRTRSLLAASSRRSLSDAPGLVSRTEATSKQQREAAQQRGARRSHPPENPSLGGKHGLILQVVSCEGQGRPQVLLRQLRIGFEQIRKRAAGTELAQYQLYRNAGAFDAWHTHHDGRVGGDAGMWHVDSATVSQGR
jgi:hypothetical protein